MSLRFLCAAAICLAMPACDDTTDPRSTFISPLSGAIHLDGPIPDAQVRLIAERNAGDLVLGQVSSDEDGAFIINTDSALGPFRIEVHPPDRAEPLVHYLPAFDSLSALRDADVAITPVTVLTSALAHRLFEDDLAAAGAASLSVDRKATLNDAIQAARELLNAHFFDVAHDLHPPQPLSEPADAPGLDAAQTLAGLAIDGLDQLARSFAESAQVGDEGIVTLASLTAALVDDVKADAVFDGRGAAGAPVLILNQFLDGHTLRRDYALALLRFVESDRNLTRFGRSEVRRLADACASSQAAIFPPDMSRLESEPPAVSITPKDGSVVAGDVFTQITTADAHRIDRVEQSSAPAGFEWRLVEGPPDEFRADEGLWYRVDYRFADTTAHPDGAFTVTAIGVDELDNATREEVRWIVDNTAPTVIIEAPVDGAILSGDARAIVAHAIDVNGLAHFELTTPDGVVHRAEIPEPGDDVVSPTEAEIRVVYNSRREVDGAYAISASAADVVRNTATTTVDVQVDNAPPVITFRSPRARELVEGLVQIIIDAGDAAPIEHFVVTTPDDAVHPIERSPDGSWRAALEWDSTTVRDGRGYAITATVADSQGNEATEAIAVDVDNVDEGIATGIAHFDSPVAGLVVEAWTLGADPARVDLCAHSREAQCVTDDDGRFEIEIADDHAGPLLLKAIADQNAFAEYVDAATGDIAGINDFDLRTLIIDYQPGGRYEGLVFSAASTLTSDWLLATLEAEEDIATQVREAITAWGRHLCPTADGAACDPTTTRPQRYDGTDAEFVAQSAGALIGLVQAGLARRAADLRLRFDEPAFWAVGLLKRFRQDMEDGVLDGRHHEEPIQVDNHPRDHRFLSACSLRSGLAAGMGSFLNKSRLLDIDTAARNQTEVEKLQMTVYLEGLSTRVDHDIWGPIFRGGRLVWDYCEYDAEGPELVISQPDDAESFGPTGGPDSADWTLRLRAQADDTAGLGEMWLDFGDLPLDFEVLNPSPTNFIAEIFYEGLAEGPLRLGLNVADLAGNLTRHRLAPAIDLTPPSVTVFTTTLDRFNPITGEITFRLDEPLESSAENPIFTAADAIVLGIASNEPITIFGTDASNVQTGVNGARYFVTFPLNPGIDRLAVTISDRQGNQTRQDIWVLRDDEGPSIDLVDSGHYQPEDTLGWQGVDCVGPDNCRRIRFDFDAPEVIEPADLELGMRGVPHAFVKLHENWNGEITGRPNQPTLDFEWADALGEGVSVDYRVLAGQAGIEGTCCNDVRFSLLAGWRPLDAGDGGVRLPVRPDTIDPQLGLDPNRVYRVETRVTNRAGISATASALFSVRLVAPPIIAWLDAERWRESGAGIGSLDFSNPLTLTEICDAESASRRRLSNLHVYNPWPYPIRVSARGVATVEQFNRKAWQRHQVQAVRAPCLGGIGTYRTSGSDARCYDAPEQLAGVIEPRQRVHRERVNVAPSVIANEVALPRDADWYVLASQQDALVSLRMPICDIPFLPADLDEPRPRRPRLAMPHPDERRALEIDRSRANIDARFDRLRAVERVSRLRFSVTSVTLRLSPPFPNAPATTWHARWTDTYDIDNPPLTLPDGLEGDDQ